MFQLATTINHGLISSFETLSHSTKPSATKACNVKENGGCVFCTQNTCVCGHYSCDISTGNNECMPGYTWNNSVERATNPSNTYHVTCPENECRNGGTCISGSCCCQMGFTGILCEVEIIECEKNSCINGGECQIFGCLKSFCLVLSNLQRSTMT